MTLIYRLQSISQFLQLIIIMGYLAPIRASFRKLFFAYGIKNQTSARFWAESLFNWLKCRVLYEDLQTKTKIESLDRCMVLFNHRSWLDFALTYLSLNKPIGQLSRRTLMILLPFGYLCTRLESATLIFFNRGNKNKKALRENLYSEIDKAYESISFFGGYPEGHRNLSQGTLPLKKGLIIYAYKRKLPIAIVLHTKQEDLVNEKKITVKKNNTVYGKHMGPYEPKHFNNFSDFYETISYDFKKGYDSLVMSSMKKEKNIFTSNEEIRIEKDPAQV